ncbi:MULTISPECIES: hypothetical protein [Oscillospiraceae]|uniref:hypothetical protein n=1 Tax=Oscillospiraceae TaxID=216572 RepID=UPI00104F06B6|nr:MULTISPECIES: hypothetical protein [Oscillospiraceae]
MYYSQLLMLSNSFSENTLDNMDKYLSGLSPAAQKLITISKVSDALQLDYQTTSESPKKVLGYRIIQEKIRIKMP